MSFPGRPLLLVPLLCLACSAEPGRAADVLKINGSTTVNPPVAEAAEILRRELGLEIRIDTQGGSSGGVSALAEGLVQIGMSSRPLQDTDHERYPEADLRAHPIGTDAVALVVSEDVWHGGVRSMTRQAMRDIYEGRVTNWTALGGPDQRIVFFNKEPGRGTWEVFATWLYGGRDEAPAVSFPEVGGNEETRSKVAGTRGALSQLSASWVDEERVFALELESADGPVVAATASHIEDGTYPMSRRLYLLTDGEPRGAAAEMLAFLLSPRGQELVRKHGYLGLHAE